MCPVSSGRPFTLLPRVIQSLVSGAILSAFVPRAHVWRALLDAEEASEILAPAASVERLLGLVANMSSATVDAPRSLPQHLAERLQKIAQRHEGEVPLHGRLFAQWLHHAFPNECPFPYITEAAVLSPAHWENGKATVSTSQRAELAAAHVMVEANLNLSWSEEEVVVVQDLPKANGGVRVLMQLALLVGLFHATLRNCQVLTRRGDKDKSKVSFDLPF
ncbi:unnamed protein product [Effrenium voratum]|nr:unnamed protein product [Effrenium voratum]